jgi:uncharacterized protein (UPF0305 family)
MLNYLMSGNLFVYNSCKFMHDRIKNIYVSFSYFFFTFKAACLKIHAIFHENFENEFKSKKKTNCKVNIESNLHIASDTYNPRQL